jgi:hypothetical protein
VLLTRLLSLVAAPITLLLVATKRPMEEQGLYFLFWNAQALSQLMELSIGALMVQFASHESASIRWNARGGVAGDSAAVQRITSVLEEGLRWYRRVAVLTLTLGGIAGGWLILVRRSEVSPEPLLPWLATIVLTAAYLPVIPLLCTIEGCEGLIRLQRMRLVQLILSIAGLWSVLTHWGALWAVAVYSLLWLAVPVLWLMRTHAGLLDVLRSGADNSRSSHFATGQWRAGATWLASWLASQSLTPIVLATQGAAAAGQVGMGLAIASAPLTLAGSWLSARYPYYGALLARGATQELRRLARHATLQASCVFVLGILGAVTAICVLGYTHPSLAARAVSPLGISLLGLGNLAWLLMYALGGYLRAWREEPLTEVSVIGAIIVIAGTFVAGLHLGQTVVIAIYSALVALVALPLAAFGFRRHHLARPQ